MADGSVKIDIVGDDSDIQKKIDDTEESLGGLGDKQKETQKETEKTKTKFDELAETIDRQSKELSDLKGEYTAAIVNFGKGSAEAKALEEKMSSLNSELSKSKEMYSKASNEAGKLTTALDENEKSFSTADVAIGSFVGNALSDLASKLVETVGNIAALADETREYREDMAKLDTAFTTAGHSTETAQKAYDDFYKILGESDRSVEAVNHLAELTKNEKEVAQWSTIAAGVTAKFGDSLPLEGLTEAANETAKVGAVTGPLADALNWASAESSVFAEALGGNDKALKAFNKAVKDGENVEDAFSAALAKMSTEQERSTAITSTLNGLYAEAGEEYNKLTANTQAARDATNNMEQAQAALGAAIEPVTTAWTNLKANAMQWFVDTGFPALQTGWQWVLDNLPAIAVIVGGLTAAWLAFGGAQTLLNAVQTAGIAIQTALNAVMSANPIGLIILAITALVAGFMLLWNNCEGFRNFWIGLWNGIKTAAAAVAEWFKNTWNATINWLKGVVPKIKDFFVEAWNGIKTAFSAVSSFFSGVWSGIKAVFSAVGSWFGSIFGAAWNAIKSAFANVTQFFSTVKDNIYNAFSNIKDKFLSIGKNIVDGIWNGISNGYEWIKGKIREWVGNVVDFCKSILGIKSPSRVFRDEVGKMIAAGIEVGIDEWADKPVEAVADIFNTMEKVLKEAQKDTVDIVKEYNAEMVELEKEKNKKLADLEKKLIEDKKKKGADRKALEQKYNEDIENLNKQHADKLASIQDNIQKTITSKMQEMVTLEQKYKADVVQVWEDLDKSITDVLANYDNQLKSRTESIANSLNLWNEASKNSVSGAVLQKNLQSQVRTLEDYNKAIANLEERNISEAFLNHIKQMGVGSTGEIEALVKMSEAQLSSYVELWEKKNELARNAAVEELEPLKAETEAKIEELTNAALNKYAELRAEYTEQGSLLMAELKQAMIEAGQGGYEEIIGQIDDYTSAGEDLMNGVIAGIVDKSPALVSAVTRAVNRAIQAAKDAAGIESPSKVMKKEVGANLAEGVKVGWAEKVDTIKNKMATDMQGITARIKTAVSLEQERMSQGVGVRDTGFSEVAQAVGMQTAGINSLASEYRRGTNKQITIPIILDKRELGRAFVEVGGEEITRSGTSLSFA